MRPDEGHRGRASAGAPGRWRLPERWRLRHAPRFLNGIAARLASRLRATLMTIRCPPPGLAPFAADGRELVMMATMVAADPGWPA